MQKTKIKKRNWNEWRYVFRNRIQLWTMFQMLLAQNNSLRFELFQQFEPFTKRNVSNWNFGQFSATVLKAVSNSNLFLYFSLSPLFPRPLSLSLSSFPIAATSSARSLRIDLIRDGEWSIALRAHRYMYIYMYTRNHFQRALSVSGIAAGENHPI